VQGVELLYCSECGQKVEGRFCPECGTPVEGGKARGLQTMKIAALGALIIIALIVGAIIASSSGRGSSPERTVKDFLAALEDGDAAMFNSVMDPKLYDYLSNYGLDRELWEQEVGLLLSLASSEWKDEYSFRIVQVKVSGETAVVTVKMTDSYGSDEDKFYLVRHNGKWYIDSSWFLEDFYK